MAHDVFISYARQDKPVADAACAVLEARGVRCWIAPRDIPAGQDWAAAIGDAIDAASALVLIFSAPVNESAQIRREMERAGARTTPILPFRIEDVPPSHAVQFALGPVHWLDALTPPLERRLAELADAVVQLLAARRQATAGAVPRQGEPARAEPHDSREAGVRAAGRPSRRQLLDPRARLGILAAGGVLVAGLIALGLWRLAPQPAGTVATPAGAPPLSAVPAATQTEVTRRRTEIAFLQALNAPTGTPAGAVSTPLPGSQMAATALAGRTATAAAQAGAAPAAATPDGLATLTATMNTVVAAATSAPAGTRTAVTGRATAVGQLIATRQAGAGASPVATPSPVSGRLAPGEAVSRVFGGSR